ncbi:MAG: hypothetical protein IV094_02935 [Vitreoscilla sp.]|nr:hypothetical protein [Vitreoscilla sp.]
MGMIAFNRNTGVNLRAANTPASAPMAASEVTEAVLVAHLTALGLAVNSIEIHFDPSTATVRVAGSVERQDQRERLVLCCGNVRGVAAVDDCLAVIMPSAVSCWRFVQPGDLFESIARDAYRDADRGDDLRSANQPLVGGAEPPTAGWLLRIPPLESLSSRRGPHAR